MVVQAQYPSNLTLHNDCSLQLQSQPCLVDDPSNNHILFADFPVGSSGACDLRKRRRGIDMNQLMSLLHQQQFHNQNVDVSTGLRLSFNDQEQLQQQHSRSSQSSVLSLLSQDLSSQIIQQRHDIDHFLHAQGEELRRTLASKRHMHYCALLLKADVTADERQRRGSGESCAA